MTAAGKAEVLARDADPLEVLRGGEHPLDQLAVLVLDPVALDQRLPRLGDAVGQAVADHLQLTEVEHPRPGGEGSDAMRYLGVAESLAEEAGQLGLEAGDLPAQLQPRLALVDRDAKPGNSSCLSRAGISESVGHAASRVDAAIHRASSTAICGTPLHLDRGNSDPAAGPLDRDALGGRAEEETERARRRRR